MICKTFSRVGTLMLTGFVAVLTLAVGVHAAQTITTPNAAEVKYSLTPGESSAAVTPAASTPVLVMGVQNSLGYRGVGQVAMLHVPSSFLEWTGIESPAAAALTAGFSGTAGTHIVYLDYSHTVQIQVASADTFVIHNANSIEMTGVVTLIW
ncbi:MAG: hypothetical protein WB523_22085 [Candidatus Sulfotelmatobacter sp.]